MVRFGVLAALGVLVGCTPMYPTPEISGPKISGPGSVEEASFPGVRDTVPEGGTARLILSHGMCSADSTSDWVTNRFNQIARLVGSAGADRTSDAALMASVRKSSNGDVELYRGTMTGSLGRRYELNLFVWGRAVDEARKALDADSGRAPEENQPRRARVNAALRDTLMNDCLIDAVFYLGPAGDGIRAGTRELWCALLGGSLTSPGGDLAAPSTCQLRRQESDPNRATFIIPESLGAKVMFDAFRQTTFTGASVAAALGPVGGIHFVTNQVLLLDQAGLPDDDGQREAAGFRAASTGGSSLLSVLDKLVPDVRPLERLTREAAPRVPIVAYTDPNDVLGYRLLDSQNPNPGRFDIYNVLFSNTNTFLPGAPILANPIEAHQGAEEADPIFELIINGTDG